MTRLLVDAASGLATSSMYHDDSLADVLVGEMLNAANESVARRTPFVKTHTWSGGELPDAEEWPLARRAAALTREPYSAILSQFTLEATHCHTCILEGIEDWAHFQQTALRLARSWAKIVCGSGGRTWHGKLQSLRQVKGGGG